MIPVEDLYRICGVAFELAARGLAWSHEDVLFYKQIMSPENDESGLVIGQLDLVATDVPGTIRYKMVFAAPGYAPYEETMKLQLGPTTVRDFELFKQGAVAAPGVVGTAATGDPG